MTFFKHIAIAISLTVALPAVASEPAATQAGHQTAGQQSMTTGNGTDPVKLERLDIREASANRFFTRCTRRGGGASIDNDGVRHCEDANGNELFD